MKIFLFLIFISNIIFAQEMYVCESYTEDGQPIGATNSLEIKPYGKAVYVLFQNKSNFNFNTLYLFVDKLSDGQFTPYDSKTLNVKKNKNWAVTNYEFHNSGIYELYFLNSAQQKLTVQKLEVRLIGENGIERITPTFSSGTGHSQFIFCDMIINDKPINQFTQLSISAKDGEGYAYINNYAPIGTDTINVKIWKRQPSSSFDALISSKKYTIKPQWTDTFFKVKFDKPGDYKIDVFDKFDNLIASNVLAVIN